MDRNAFVRGLLATIAIVASPVIALAKKLPLKRNDKGFAVQAGKDRFGKSLPIFDGDTFFCKVSGKDTDGDLYIFESTRTRPGGPALHVHPDQDEWWYVMQGEFKVKVGENLYHAKPGDTVFGPRGVPHTFSKVGDGEARIMIGFQPAGKMEEFFHAVSEGKLGKLSDAEKDAFRMAHGFERIGPPLDQLKSF